MKWLEPHAGKPVPARPRLGNAKHKPIEPAPGALREGTRQLIVYSTMIANFRWVTEGFRASYHLLSRMP
jgi:hypothetical protein